MFDPSTWTIKNAVLAVGIFIVWILDFRKVILFCDGERHIFHVRMDHPMSQNQVWQVCHGLFKQGEAKELAYQKTAPFLFFIFFGANYTRYT